MSTASSHAFRAVIAGALQQDIFCDGVVPAVDLTILGNGFFVVRDVGAGDYLATQSGLFSLDVEGYLVTDTGERLQGRVDGSCKKVGDMRVSADLTSAKALRSSMLCYSIDRCGRIMVYLADGTSFSRGQVMLQNFSDPEALVNEGHELFSNLSAAGPLPALAAPGTNGLGAIQSDVPQLCHAEPTHWTN